MNLTEKITDFSENIINMVNSSGLHPSICKIILLNTINEIEKFEINQTNNKEENNQGGV